MAKRKDNESKGATKIKKQRLEEDKVLAAGFGNFSVPDVESSDDVSEESDWENEEQDYENIPRSLKGNKKVVEGLPIKTSEGRIQRTIIEKDDVNEDESGNESEKEEDKKEDKKEQQAEEEAEDYEEVYKYAENLTESQQIIQLQEDIAEMVEKLIELPEENISSLTRLRKMLNSKNPNTSRYSLLALVPAFKSIVPGYRIRPLTETEKKEKVSKDVNRLRTFEQSLLANYKAYINILAANAKNISKNSTVARMSITAACELIGSLSHFNFVEDLLAITIRYSSRFKGALPKNPEDAEKLQNIALFHRCIETLKLVLEEDVTYGKTSFDICRFISKSLKQKKYHVNKDLLGLYLHLAILSDYDPQNTEEESAVKIKKKNRVHLSKKERKARKERKEIEEEMRKAELQVSQEERDKNQSEILKLVLANYLQVLKVRNDHLMGTVLEGLSMYGFMANLELIGDFLQILKELIYDISTESNLNDHRIKQILFCIVTSFTLMSNGSNKIRMDMSKFIDVLYSILLDISMDEEINKSIKLLIRTLESIFITSKASPRSRNLAFTKRIYMLLLNTSEKPTLALLNFLSKFMDKAPEVKGMYKIDDRVENGLFVMEAEHPNRSNAEAANIWETSLLVNHYCPAVAKGTRNILKQAKSG